MADNIMEQKNNMKKHFILIGGLLLIAGVLECIVWLHYDELRADPLVFNRFFEISPVYNTNGSWFHGKIGIGYIRWLLLLESIIIFLVLIFGFRYIDAVQCFYKVRTAGLYGFDFGIAVALYRLFTGIRGLYTLDYLHVIGYMTYDFPDLCIGIFIFFILVFMVMIIPKSHKLKKEKTAGMKFFQKFLWECRLGGMFLRAAVCSKENWQELFDKWE